MRNSIVTFTVTIWMAGDIDTAKRFLRRRCHERGLCVTVTPTTFIYTGGEETGFQVGFVNYPRFPSTPGEIWTLAVEIAHQLIFECCQKSALVVSSSETLWISMPPAAAYSPDKVIP